MFNSSMHVATSKIYPRDEVSTVIGFDSSGLNLSCCILQAFDGRWCVTDEIISSDSGLETFIEQFLVPLLKSSYNRCPVVCVFDPSNTRDSYQALTPEQHLNNHGVKCAQAVTNNIAQRILAVEKLLNKVAGGILVSPTCTHLIKALEGRYCYKRLKVSGSISTVYDNKPDKSSAYSHIADALQYAALHILREGKSDETKNKIIKLQNFNRLKVLSRLV